MAFEKGKAIIIVSASLDNTYLLFGYKETNQTLAKKTEVVQVFTIESTNVKPKFEIFPPGSRTYILQNWNEIGSEFSIAGITSEFTAPNTVQEFEPGEVPIIPELYLAIKNFNPDIKEPPLGTENIRVLGFRAGEIVMMTIATNRGGWFEGYRANDPDHLCGLAHISCFKKINFS